MDKNKMWYNLNKKISLWALLTCAALTMCGCSVQELLHQVPGELTLPEDSRPDRVYLAELGDIQRPLAESQKVKRISLEDIEGGTFLSDSSSHYAYDALSAGEKIWYRDMEQAFGSMTDKVKLSEDGIKAGLDESAVDKIFQSVLCDHPELFFVEGYAYTQYTKAEKTVAVELSGAYGMDRDAALRRKWEIEEVVSGILGNAPTSGDDYEKTKYVYETLIKNTEYDIEAPDNQNIYSVFVNRSSVCQGYAKAAQYLLNRLGIFCTLVQGSVLESGEGHAWDLVRLDGEYYYMDPTWGDISYQTAENGDEGNLPQISYDYLCITTAQLERTHKIEGQTEMPVCTAERDNYYVRENALFTEFNADRLSALVAEARAQGRNDVTLRCADQRCFDEMCDLLLERQEILRYLSGNGSGSFAYTKNDTQLTMTFFMMTSQ